MWNKENTHHNIYIYIGEQNSAQAGPNPKLKEGPAHTEPKLGPIKGKFSPSLLSVKLPCKSVHPQLICPSRIRYVEERRYCLGKICPLNTRFSVKYKLQENDLDSIVVGPIIDA